VNLYKNFGKRVLLSKIPLNDQKTLQLLSLAKTNGVFQLESYGMKKTLLEVKVDSFDDIVAIISLFRPGPMDNIPLYANRKKNIQKIKSISLDYDLITKNTYGIIVYQEQIMEIAQKISGMSFAQADIFRRAIGKKEQTLIFSLKQKFIDGSIKKGYKIEEAKKIYDLIEKFANYGFNKSHAVSYGMISY
jgi:DNA polymerase-3 subunit alpha